MVIKLYWLIKTKDYLIWFWLLRIRSCLCSLLANVSCFSGILHFIKWLPRPVKNWFVFRDACFVYLCFLRWERILDYISGFAFNLLTFDGPKPWRPIGSWDCSHVQDRQVQIRRNRQELDSEVCHGLNILPYAGLNLYKQKQNEMFYLLCSRLTTCRTALGVAPLQEERWCFEIFYVWMLIFEFWTRVWSLFIWFWIVCLVWHICVNISLRTSKAFCKLYRVYYCG